MRRFIPYLCIILFVFLSMVQDVSGVALLNVSYDPTRELYKSYNAWFVKEWKAKTGQQLYINQSHGGSGKQARSVIDGLEADVVTLGLAYDIDMIAQKSKRIPVNWQSKLPYSSSPYTSTIVFLVRKGNPKQLRDWADLIRPGVQVVMPNPKTSGGARWNFLAAWGYALRQFKTEVKAKEFVAKLYRNVPVLDSGARGSTTTFVERRLGDVLVTWEDEALLITRKLYPNKFEVIYPSISVLAQPPVAVVEADAKKRGTLSQAQAYLKGLYSEPAQEIIAQNFYRPTSISAQKKYATLFPTIRLMAISEFGGWQKAQLKFFSDGGVFDSIYTKK